MKNKILSSNALLILLIALENLFLYYFYCKKWLRQDINACGLFLCSVFFGCIVLYRFYNNTLTVNTEKIEKNYRKYLLLLCFWVALFALGCMYQNLLRHFTIDPSFSDVVPMILHMSGNFVHGLSPYTPVFMNGSTEFPTYLPTTWLPFCIAGLLHFDPRMIPFVAWCIAACWLYIRAVNIKDIRLILLCPLLIIVSLCALMHYYNGVITGRTTEVMIAAYYMMLMIGLNQSNGIVQGVLIAICLLSRYSLVLWLPLYAFVLFISGSRKQLFQSVLTTSVIVLLVYVIPFLSKDWTLLSRSYQAYNGAAIGEWTRMNPDGYPYQLYTGTGFAYSIYSSFPFLSIAERIKLLQHLHLFLSLLITVIMGIWYWRKKDKIDTRIFLMAAFKIYLAFFLFFIQVPYVYLMCVGNFISIAIFCEQARYTLVPKKQ